jgi:hypothetical protein
MSHRSAGRGVAGGGGDAQGATGALWRAPRRLTRLGDCVAVVWAGGALRFDARDELAERVQPRHDRDPLVSVACRDRVPEQSTGRLLAV